MCLFYFSYVDMLHDNSIHDNSICDKDCFHSLDYCSPLISLLWEWCPWVGLYVSQLQVSLDFILVPETRAPSLFVTISQLRVAFVACLVTTSWGVQSTRDYLWSVDLPYTAALSVQVFPCLSRCPSSLSLWLKADLASWRHAAFSPVVCILSSSRLHKGGWGARLHGISCL